MCQVAGFTNEQLANTFYFHHVPSDRFYKQTTCKYLLFSSCSKWQVLQTNNLQIPFIFFMSQWTGSTNEQLAITFIFIKSVIPNVSG